MKLKNVWLELSAYCSYSSLHGFGYLNSCRNWFETGFWLLVIGIAIIYPSVLIASTFQSWGENPISIDVETLSFDIKDIQFPTITICPPETVSHWNLPRLWLNMFPFKCNSAQECASNSIRENFKEFLQEIPKVVKVPIGYAGICII